MLGKSSTTHIESEVMCLLQYRTV